LEIQVTFHHQALNLRRRAIDADRGFLAYAGAAGDDVDKRFERCGGKRGLIHDGRYTTDAPAFPSDNVLYQGEKEG
jgi:hypothetical protein